MSFAAEVNRSYATTRLTLAEELEHAKEHSCKHPRYACESAVDETVKCAGCEKYFCQTHMVDDLCAGCDRIDAAADALLESEAA